MSSCINGKKLNASIPPCLRKTIGENVCIFLFFIYENQSNNNNNNNNNNYNVGNCIKI